jgi:hypothetical protein
MQPKQEMWEHHPEWDGRAEIVVISLDDDTESRQKGIKEKGWCKVTSFWVGAWGSPTSKPFNIQGIPTRLS